MKKYFLCLAFAGLGAGSLARAQTPAPYLTEATFTLSVDDWADISINGIPIIDSQPYTSAEKGPQTTTAVPKSLCYFERENVLAIEVTDKSVGVTIGQDSVGIAYLLRLKSSDGRELILSSDNAADHTGFYIADKMAGSPRDWQKMAFDDSSWTQAFCTGPLIPYAAQVIDPRTNQPVSFLSARSISSKSQFAGERHLFRRKFFLNIGNNPNCDKSMEAPRIGPLVLEQPDQRHPVLIPTKTPTPTPTPQPTPTAVFYPAPVLNPTPVKRIVSSRPVRRPRPRPTPTLGFSPPAGRVVLDSGEPSSSTPVLLPSPTPVITVQTEGSEGQTIVFDRPPANIYMSFADGPGVYRLEVWDKDGRRVRNLYEKKIIAMAEDWATWDGKDEQGLDCPRGWYFVIFSKDGKMLKKILAGKTSPN